MRWCAVATKGLQANEQRGAPWQMVAFLKIRQKSPRYTYRPPGSRRPDRGGYICYDRLLFTGIGHAGNYLLPAPLSAFGLAIAQRLTQAGYWVALHSRASSAAGRQAAAMLAGAHYFQADLLEGGERRKLINHGRPFT